METSKVIYSTSRLQVDIEENDIEMPVFTFGKHNGKPYDYVKRTDVAYCNWALKQINSNGRMLHFQRWLRARAKKVTCECCNGSGLVDAV